MPAPEIEKIARAVMYEGYNLYPYRPSAIKNRFRWPWGTLYPPSSGRGRDGAERSCLQAQFLLEGTPEGSLRVGVRFLHPLLSAVGQTLSSPHEAGDPSEGPPPHELVASIEVAGQTHCTWHRAVEREVCVEARIEDLLTAPRQTRFEFPASVRWSPLAEAEGRPTLLQIERQKHVRGVVELSACVVSPGLLQVTLSVINEGAGHEESHGSSDACDLLDAMASCHVLLVAVGASFVSMTDPPAPYKAHAAACRNEGVWPVLVGHEGSRDTMLASPIILSDYPRVAPQSPGDYFDATEIDQMLALRVMTLTDDEKRIAASVDEPTGRLFARSQSLSSEQLAGLHAVMQMQRAESARVGGVELRAGDRVRLKPRGGADAFDILLADMIATIGSVEQDLEGHIYFSVTLDDDPGRDLGERGQPGHRFFYRPDEVEPLHAAAEAE